MTALRFFYFSLLGISSEAFLTRNSFILKSWNQEHIGSYTKTNIAVAQVNKQKEKDCRDLSVFQIETKSTYGRRKLRKNLNRERSRSSSLVQRSSNFDTGNRPNTAFRRGRWRKFRVGRLRRFRDRAIFSNPDSIEELTVVNEDGQTQINDGETKRVFSKSKRRKSNTELDLNEVGENHRFETDPTTAMDESIEEFTSATNDQTNESNDSDCDNDCDVGVLKENVNRNDISEKKKEGKRVEFRAKEKSSRLISLDDKSCALFLEYMRQPVEDYSLRSFSEPTNKNISARRWLVRRLSKEESNQYLSPGECYIDNFFRIGAPLKPLLGLDLTPVIDMQVTPSFVSDSYKSDTTSTLKKNATNSFQLGSRWRKRISTGMARDAAKSNKDIIKIRSTRVDLLSTVEEISQAMNNRGPLNTSSSSSSNESIMQPSATAVSSNRNIQEFGNEAIGFFGKIDKNIHPHLEFDTTISWSSQESLNGKSPDLIKMKITVETSMIVSLTIPAIPLPLPIPTSLAVKQIGSLLTDQLLRLVQPKFLNQIGMYLLRIYFICMLSFFSDIILCFHLSFFAKDRDFKRWSSSPTIKIDQIEM